MCDDRWDVREARVVCQQLGYEGREWNWLCVLPTVSSSLILPFIPASYPLLNHGNGSYRHSPHNNLHDIHCTGMEVMLSECGGEETDDCNHGKAGVICTSMSSV